MIPQAPIIALATKGICISVLVGKSFYTVLHCYPVMPYVGSIATCLAVILGSLGQTSGRQIQAPPTDRLKPRGAKAIERCKHSFAKPLYLRKCGD